MRFTTASYALAAAFLLSFASATHLIPDTKGTLPLKDNYDYIVVGAGIGGLVVANRLSEDPSGEISPINELH